MKNYSLKKKNKKAAHKHMKKKQCHHSQQQQQQHSRMCAPSFLPYTHFTCVVDAKTRGLILMAQNTTELHSEVAAIRLLSRLRQRQQLPKKQVYELINFSVKHKTLHVRRAEPCTACSRCVRRALLGTLLNFFAAVAVSLE